MDTVISGRTDEPTAPSGTNDKGFTLIELIIVVVVIAVLSAIAVPLYGSVRSDAGETTAHSGAREISNHVQASMIQHDWSPGFAIARTKEVFDAQNVPGESNLLLSRWTTSNDRGLYCIAASYDSTGTKTSENIWDSEHPVGLAGNNCSYLDYLLSETYDWYDLKGIADTGR